MSSSVDHSVRSFVQFGALHRIAQYEHNTIAAQKHLRNEPAHMRDSTRTTAQEGRRVSALFAGPCESVSAQNVRTQQLRVRMRRHATCRHVVRQRQRQRQCDSEQPSAVSMSIPVFVHRFGFLFPFAGFGHLCPHLLHILQYLHRPPQRTANPQHTTPPSQVPHADRNRGRRKTHRIPIWPRPTRSSITNSIASPVARNTENVYRIVAQRIAPS
jgi:hypothetical protein